MNKKPFLFYCLLLLPNLVNAQFYYRLELSAEGGQTNQYDKLSTKKDNINYYEETFRKGTDVSLGISYRITKYPIFISTTSSFKTYNEYKFNSDLQVLDDKQRLIINSYGLDFKYIAFNKTVINPFISVGFSYNNINYTRDSINYRYFPPSNIDYILIEKIEWGYNKIKTSYATFGLYSSIGIRIRIFDHIGLNGSVKFEYLPQNQSELMGNTVLIRTYNIGLYYRMLKQKNYFQ